MSSAVKPILVLAAFTLAFLECANSNDFQDFAQPQTEFEEVQPVDAQAEALQLVEQPSKTSNELKNWYKVAKAKAKDAERDHYLLKQKVGFSQAQAKQANKDAKVSPEGALDKITAELSRGPVFSTWNPSLPDSGIEIATSKLQGLKPKHKKMKPVKGVHKLKKKVARLKKKMAKQKMGSHRQKT